MGRYGEMAPVRGALSCGVRVGLRFGLGLTPGVVGLTPRSQGAVLVGALPLARPLPLAVALTESELNAERKPAPSHTQCTTTG